MEAKAIARYVKVSPKKMRLVADIVRGKNSDEAINILHFTQKIAARHVEKVVRSAVANLQYIHPEVNPKDVIVKTIFVDGGPFLKRVRPGSMGRRSMIRKRTSHITVVVESSHAA